MAAAACPGKPGATGSGLASWIMLDEEAYMEDRENVTTAEGKTSSGQRVKVSFFAADPPGLSHLCVHWPGLDESCYGYRPSACVLKAEDNLALITIKQNYTPEYFFYTAAGRGRRPSIEPHPAEVANYLEGHDFTKISVGFLPCGGDDGDYVVAALSVSNLVSGGKNELHVFRSEQGTWTKIVLAHGRHRIYKVEKVIAMGGGCHGYIFLG